MFVGAFFVPEGSGLAAGAIVLGYGGGGILAVLVLGMVLAIKLPRRPLVRATWIALAGVVLAGVILFVRYRCQSIESHRRISAHPRAA